MKPLLNRRVVLSGAAATFLTLPLARGESRATGLTAVTLDGNDVTLSNAELARLGRTLKGGVLTPADRGYEQARHIWNAMFDRHPTLIAKCSSVEDVRTAVKFARDKNLLAAVRCGGHSISGQSVVERGMVIDLSGIRGVTVNPARRTVRVGGGCLLGDVDAAAQKAGLASTFGVVSHTGVGGLTLGGGMGRLQRQYGLAVDNLLEVELVTADGKVVVANQDRNPDLFWGVRGGGGNFGIVTAFTFQLHAWNYPVASRSFTYGATRAAQVLNGFFDYCNEAPDELWASCVLGRAPSGDVFVSVGGEWLGDPDGGVDALQKLGSFGTVQRERASTANYVELQKAGDAASRHGRYHYSKAGMLPGTQGSGREQLVDAIVEPFLDMPIAGARTVILMMGGAVNRVAADATAYPHRASMQNIDVGGSADTREGAETYMTWGREYWKSIEPHTGGGFYINALIDESERKVRANFGPNADRLVALKTRYDPANFFRLNANIKPQGMA
jgi:FAD/FMN-containing dehydrogenase